MTVKIKSRRYWFIFLAVFVLTQAMISQVSGIGYNNLNLLIRIVIGILVSILLVPLLIKY
jgi:hypothetical protein